MDTCFKYGKTKKRLILKNDGKDGIKGNVEPYDWRYYAEKIEKNV